MVATRRLTDNKPGLYDLARGATATEAKVLVESADGASEDSAEPVEFNPHLKIGKSEGMEAAFADTEGGCGKGAEMPIQPLYYPSDMWSL